ncbi:MAG: hypothetical protein A2Z18_07315 [Armatimonadetes bacterium RBG_16_58_9]|nr:MAG: hypothetical protein A2Z18_07315 [Armatimonadetes bacterium RBG_16_58_9]
MFAVIILAAALRVYGLRWGLPNTLHGYSYHPDEFLTVTTAYLTMYAGRSLLPGFYNYPTLYIYLCILAIAVAQGYGLVSNEAGIYLSARVVTVIMGVAAVSVTYWAGKRLYSAAAGLIAALVLCIAPLHAQHSHFATVDVPSTVFVAASLGFAGLIMTRGSWRDYVLAGAMVGLAGGTKYNAGVVVFSIVAAHLLRGRVTWQSIASGRLWTSLGCAIAAFIISTPGVVLQTPAFLHGIGYEVAHASEGHGLVFAGTGCGFVYTFTSSLWYGLGPPLAFLFPASALYALWRRDRSGLVILAFVIPYYVLISLSQVRFARYALPLFPAVALLCGWFAREMWLRVSTRWLRWSWAGACVVAAVFTLVYTLALDRLFTVPDPRDQAARWVFAHVRKEPIGLIDVPWFYTPPLSKQLGTASLLNQPRTWEEFEEVVRSTPYELLIFSRSDKPGSWWEDGHPPKWAIVSSYEIDDALRLRHDKRLTEDQRDQVRRILADLDLITRHYVPKEQFGDLLHLSLPHDMGYTDPRITIYELRR